MWLQAAWRMNLKNTFGNSIAMTLFGESHGKAVGVVIDGLAPGLKINEDDMSKMLSRRAPSDGESERREKDNFEILSGVFNGKSTGTPLTIVIPNTDVRSGDYSYGTARPSHADYAAYCKYHGYEDYRGGGHFSGRVTAAIAAAGAIFISALEKLGISLESRVLSCGGAESASGEEIQKAVLKAKQRGDSIGGTVLTEVSGLPAGLGEPWFDSVESLLSHAMFSIGGIKGIEFGAGFGCTEMYGSEFNDTLRVENGKIISKSNNSGGINGGITNGMPIVFRCAVRPTASISKEQETVDFVKNENVTISVSGRHDPCIVRRVCPVIESMTAFVLCDMLASRYGTDVFLRGMGR